MIKESEPPTAFMTSMFSSNALNEELFPDSIQLDEIINMKTPKYSQPQYPNSIEAGPNQIGITVQPSSDYTEPPAEHCINDCSSSSDITLDQNYLKSLPTSAHYDYEKPLAYLLPPDPNEKKTSSVKVLDSDKVLMKKESFFRLVLDPEVVAARTSIRFNRDIDVGNLPVKPCSNCINKHKENGFLICDVLPFNYEDFIPLDQNREEFRAKIRSGNCLTFHLPNKETTEVVVEVIFRESSFNIKKKKYRFPVWITGNIRRYKDDEIRNRFSGKQSLKRKMKAESSDYEKIKKEKLSPRHDGIEHSAGKLPHTSNEGFLLLQGDCDQLREIHSLVQNQFPNLTSIPASKGFPQIPFV